MSNVVVHLPVSSPSAQKDSLRQAYLRSLVHWIKTENPSSEHVQEETEMVHSAMLQIGALPRESGA